MMICWIIPACIYFAAALILALFYKISDADAAKYAQENAAKMQK